MIEIPENTKHLRSVRIGLDGTSLNADDVLEKIVFADNLSGTTPVHWGLRQLFWGSRPFGDLDPQEVVLNAFDAVVETKITNLSSTLPHQVIRPRVIMSQMYFPLSGGVGDEPINIGLPDGALANDQHRQRVRASYTFYGGGYPKAVQVDPFERVKAALLDVIAKSSLEVVEYSFVVADPMEPGEYPVLRCIVRVRAEPAEATALRLQLHEACAAAEREASLPYQSAVASVRRV